jgi:hypothetical protein
MPANPFPTNLLCPNAFANLLLVDTYICPAYAGSSLYETYSQYNGYASGSFTVMARLTWDDESEHWPNWKQWS